MEVEIQQPVAEQLLLVRSQRLANILTKTAPTIFLGADISGLALAFTTGNLFIIMGLVAFTIAKFAGYCAKLEKKEMPVV